MADLLTDTIIITPCGDQALLVGFRDQSSHAANALALWLGTALAERKDHPGIIAAIPGLETCLVQYDPCVTAGPEVAGRIQALWDEVGADVSQGAVVALHRHDIPVCYGLGDGAEFGPDLVDAVQTLGLTPEDLVEAHAGQSYTVRLMGFMPGFGYLGDVAEALRLPRRATPRVRVPAGAVAIADRFTAIYPQSSPGGWHLIGRCPLALFDPHRPPGARLAPGDTVRFYAITPAEFASLFQAGARDGR